MSEVDDIVAKLSARGVIAMIGDAGPATRIAYLRDAERAAYHAVRGWIELTNQAEPPMAASAAGRCRQGVQHDHGAACGSRGAFTASSLRQLRASTIRIYRVLRYWPPF
jgi:hypothetical protein